MTTRLPKIVASGIRKATKWQFFTHCGKKDPLLVVFCEKTAHSACRTADPPKACTKRLIFADILLGPLWGPFFRIFEETAKSKDKKSSKRRLYQKKRLLKIDFRGCGKTWERFGQKMLISCGKNSENPLTNAGYLYIIYLTYRATQGHIMPKNVENGYKKTPPHARA